MKYLFYLLPLLIASVTVQAQQKEKDKKNIEKLCGCFDVDFKYAETFSPNRDYKYHSREQLSGTELVLPIETSDNKYVLQHLLLVDDGYIIKHWREDWTYESPVLFTYQGNKQWTKETLPSQEVKNKWTQTVWEVDDAPRYQGVGQWITSNGKTYWENTTNAPLPRREYTTRNDYNILRRGNRIVVADNKWVHEQDNEKIRRTSGNDTLIAEEKGINEYKRVADSKCAKAKEWWEKNAAFWNTVRSEWDAQIKNVSTINLQSTVDKKRLYELFDELHTQWSSHKLSQAEVNAQVKTLIGKFLTVPAMLSKKGETL